MNTKYPKTTGHYNYAHILPNKMCYFGMSSQQPSERWQPSHYKTTVLGPYIKQYGWDNIEHMVIQDGLTKRQAEVIEDWFIKNATKDGFCLNRQRSGGIKRDNPKQYKREYSKTEKFKEYQREYQKTEKYKEYQREYRKTEKCKECKREYNQRPEVKERKREYNREYMQEYRQRPEVKERQRESSRKYYQKKKALKN